MPAEGYTVTGDVWDFEGNKEYSLDLWIFYTQCVLFFMTKLLNLLAFVITFKNKLGSDQIFLL